VKLESFAINLTSEEPGRLLAFYRDTVGLTPRPEMGDGALQLGDATLFVDGHSEIKGGAKEPARALIDFFVADLAAEQKRLEAAGVKFIRTAGKEYWGGTVSTFLDPDGNYDQLLQMPG
jgi:predicted enzyme related to lactoylglutathione lyase